MEPPFRARTRSGVVAALVALLVVGCAGTEAPQVAGDVPGADEPAASDDPADAPPDLPECLDDRELSPPPEEQPPTDPAITSPELFEDIAIADDGVPERDDGGEPHGMEPFGAAAEWAEREAPDHYAGMWIDNDHNAAVIAFTDDVDRYATEVRERFGAGWWVVEAEHSLADLLAVQERINADGLGGFGQDGEHGGPGTIVGTATVETSNRVEVMVVGGDAAALAALVDEIDDDRVCFAVLPPPPTYDPDGPVRTLATVAGWRDGLSFDAFGHLEVADDPEAAERAFAENVPDDLPPGDGEPWADALHAGLDTVDLEEEVVVVWSSGRSGSCPEWIEDVRTVGDEVEITSASPSSGFCTDDYNAYRTVLAVPRDRLPEVDELPAVIAHEVISDPGEVVPYP